MQLIDYFHELRLMKEGEDINFQKASCTLDGCVKVYSTRVDSVVTETSRFLSGLSDKNRTDDSSKSKGNSDCDDDDDEVATKKRQKKKVSTLSLPHYSMYQILILKRLLMRGKRWRQMRRR